MKKWLASGAAVLAGALVAAVVIVRSGTRDAPAAPDAIVEDFRAVERRVIAAYNLALRRQRANEIDELELAAIIERDVLDPWRAMHARIASAPVPGDRRDLYEIMRRYVDERQLAWQAYADALRAHSDAEARPLYDAHHQKNAEAQEDARRLGALLRKYP